MLTAFFKVFFGVSLSLSPLILLFHLAGPTLRKRYSAYLYHWVWLVFALRLLLPIPLYEHSPLLLSSGEAVYFLEQDPSVAARAFAEAASSSLTDGVALFPGQVGISWMGIGAMVWIAGAVIFFLFHLAAQWKMHHELRRWSIPVQDNKTVALFEQSKREQAVTRPIRLRICMRMTSPMLTGLFRPYILLPYAGLKEQQLASVFRHELMHYKRGDLWYKLLLMTVLALNWYNPFVYLLVWQAENAMELACDSDVLRSGGVSRKEYGLAILSQLRPDKTKYMLLTTQFYGGKKDMKLRIQQIADSSRKKNGFIAIIFCAVLIISGSVLVGCAPAAVGTFQKTAPAQSVVLQESTSAVSEVKEEQESDSSSPTSEEKSELTDTIFKSSTLDADGLQQLSERIKHIATNSKLQYAGGTMAWPAPEGEQISLPYGSFGEGQFFHSGIDITGKEIYGTPVVAAQDGTVAFKNTQSVPGEGYGYYIIVDHGGGIVTMYAHLSKILVQENEAVVKGQKIGEVGTTGGTTGPHVHFEVLKDGESVDPSGYLLPDEAEKTN
ncbi:M56 family metallopeptidase [Oscillospiraceae bacterium LTW-04]|nr:M23/M56 family metallopeptidase [Oscillospiraceae bacterium MB24-C1]